MIPFLSISTALAAGREDVLAACPAEVTRADLGRLYDAEFRPLLGPDRVFSSPVAPLEVPGETSARWVTTSVDTTLRAEASLWTLAGSASLQSGADDSSVRALYYAYQADRIVVLDERSLRDTQVPNDAVWYLAAVYEGRMFQAFCEGDRASVDALAAGRASWAIGSGSVTLTGEHAHSRVACNHRLLGMRPRPGAEGATLAMTGAADLGAFEPDGSGRAVLVRYSRVPDTLRPAPEPAPPVAADRVRVLLREIRFPARKPNGEPWDALGGAPDIAFVVSDTDGRTGYRSAVAQDRYTAAFGATLLDQAERRGTLTVTVWDQDLSAPDPAGAVQLWLDKIVEPVSEASVGEIVTAAGVTVVFEIGPAEVTAP